MAETATKPTWDIYAADLAKREAERDSNFVTAFVVGVLGYVVENESVGVDEHEQAMCKAWLERLVDSQGNPRDEFGRSVIEHVMEENALSQNGSLTNVFDRGDRLVLELSVLKTIPARAPSRDEVREKFVEHLTGYADTLVQALYEPEEPSVEQV